MKVLVSLLPLEIQWQPELWSRPLGMWQLAGEAIITHVLDNLVHLALQPDDELCFAVSQTDSPVAECVRQRYVDRPLRLICLPGESALLQVARQTHEWWAQESAVWLMEGHVILRAKYLVGREAIQFLIPSLATSGLATPELENSAMPIGVYSHRGTQLWEVIANNPTLSDLLELRLQLVDEDIDVGAVDLNAIVPVAEYTSAGWQSNQELLLAANARLLGFGPGSQDVIERSYAEDFTVLPPVYVDDSAVVYGSVIGPYTTVEAGATIQDSIVRNSLVGAKATINNALLDGALIGEGAIVNGRAEALLLGDNQEYSKQ